jgi:CheY-like chemotaxis protein
MKKALLVKKDMPANKFIIQALNELGYEAEVVHSFSKAVQKIRNGFDAVITGLYLDTSGETGFGEFGKSGALVARTAKDSGVPHVILATTTSGALDSSDENLLAGIKVVDLLDSSREEMKRILAEELSGDSVPASFN